MKNFCVFIFFTQLLLAGCSGKSEQTPIVESTSSVMQQTETDVSVDSNVIKVGQAEQLHKYIPNRKYIAEGYISALKKSCKGLDEPVECKYYLFDFNKDNTPEMVVLAGRC